VPGSVVSVETQNFLAEFWGSPGPFPSRVARVKCCAAYANTKA